MAKPNIKSSKKSAPANKARKSSMASRMPTKKIASGKGGGGGATNPF